MRILRFCSYRKAPYSLLQAIRRNSRYLPLIERLIKGDEVLILIRNLLSEVNTTDTTVVSDNEKR